MNKQEALIILKDLQQYDPNSDQFITTWYNYDERSLTWNNGINEAIDTVSKYPDLNTIALEIDDHFISELKDWYCEIE